MAIDPIYSAVLQQALEIIIDVMRPILNRDLTASAVEIHEDSIDLVKQTFEEDFVMVHAPISGAVEADKYFFISKRLAAAVTDLMVMGDGTAEFNEAESLDGIAEAVNQIIGAQTTSWGESLKTDFSTEGAQASVILPSDIPFEPAGMLTVQLKVSITDWGDDTICFSVSKALYDVLKALVDSEGVDQTSETAGPGTETDEPVAEGAVKRAEFGELDQQAGIGRNGDTPRNLDLLMDITLPVTIELGRTEMLIRDVLELGPGSVIELQKLSGEPVDLYINDKQFALGEVVVIDENFGVRITELLSVEDRIKALK